MHNRLLRLVPALIVAALVFVPANTASAQQASKWVQVLSSQVRLVRGAMQPDGSIQAGVHIQLDKDWKTYWRVPGDAGVPPEFNWAGSVNVADISVLWPAPVWLRDQFGVSIGYKDEVVFPIVVRPGDWTKASTLNLNLHFAVCNEICAPVQATLRLDLPSQSIVPLFAGLIARYMAKVPKPAEEKDVPRVANVRIEAGDEEVYLVVDVAMEEMTDGMDLFIVGPEEFYFTTPQEIDAGQDLERRYRIRVDGAGGIEALAGAELNFVLVQGDKRLAQRWRLQ